MSDLSRWTRLDSGSIDPVLACSSAFRGLAKPRGDHATYYRYARTQTVPGSARLCVGRPNVGNTCVLVMSGRCRRRALSAHTDTHSTSSPVDYADLMLRLR